jgi:hypothetical protein
MLSCLTRLSGPDVSQSFVADCPRIEVLKNSYFAVEDSIKNLVSNE